MADHGESRITEGSVSSVNRRRLLKAAGVAGVTGLAGCSKLTGGASNDDGSSGGSDELTYWTLFGGGDGETMAQMVEQTNSEVDFTINRQRVPFGEYYDRLYTSLTGGEAPDIAIMHADRLRSYQDLVVPLSDRVNTDPYVDTIADRCKVDGELLGAPLDTHPYGLWYNKDLFEEAGLDPESPPESPEQFMESCRAINENTDAWPAQIHAGGLFTIMFHMWNRSRGNQLLTDSNEPGFDNQDGIDVATFYDELVNERGWVPQSSETGWNAWNSGEAGFLFDGTWHLGVVRQNDFDFGVTKPFTMPESDDPVTSGNSHTIVIPKNPNRSDAKTENAIATIEKLTQEHNLSWGKNAGHLPANSEALESDELRNSDTWEQSLSTFNSMAENDEIAYMPKTEKNGQYQEQIWQQMNAVRQDEITPEEAIQQAAEGVRQTFQ